MHIKGSSQHSTDIASLPRHFIVERERDRVQEWRASLKPPSSGLNSQQVAVNAALMLMYSHTYAAATSRGCCSCEASGSSRVWDIGRIWCDLQDNHTDHRCPPPLHPPPPPPPPLHLTSRVLLDPYFSEMFRPSGGPAAAVQGERGDSLDVCGSSGPTPRRFTCWLTEWEDGTSRTATRLSASTVPVGMEEHALGTRSLLKLQKVSPNDL